MRPFAEKPVPAADTSFVCIRRSDPSFEFLWHFHAEYELTYIESSSGTRFVGDSIQPYSRGDLVLIGPNLPHTWASEDLPDTSAISSADPRHEAAQHRAVVVLFHPRLFESQMIDMPELGDIRRLLRASSRGLRILPPAAAEIAWLLHDLPEAGRLDRLIRLLQVLARISQVKDDFLQPLASQGFAPVSGAAGEADVARIDAVLRLIHTRFRDAELTQADLAAAAYMTPAGFARFFKRVTGTTCTRYLIDRRISYACELLIETDMPILNICHESGFGGLSNFNRQFRKCKSCTPRDFRAAYQR